MKGLSVRALLGGIAAVAVAAYFFTVEKSMGLTIVFSLIAIFLLLGVKE